MRIYHYTNLEALALILKNRTIRFNRLDQVDDLEEGNAESLGVRFCKYVFVSCWTESSEESIPLWKMYGGDVGGVRISIEHNMFKEYLITNLNLDNGLSTQGAIISKIPQRDMENPDFFILPILDYDNDLFYRKIKYVDDVSEHTRKAIKVTNLKDGRGDIAIDTKQFGSYKNKRWEFQNETRFVLYAFPFNPLREGANPQISTIVAQSFLSNKALSFKYYDMHLKEGAMETIEITLSPSVTDAQRVIIQALIEKYAPKVIVKDSSLGNVVRLK